MTDMATEQDDNFDHHRGAEPLLRESPLWRRLLFLGLAFALFILANMFWQYLSSGSWRNFSPRPTVTTWPRRWPTRCCTR